MQFTYGGEIEQCRSCLYQKRTQTFKRRQCIEYDHDKTSLELCGDHIGDHFALDVGKIMNSKALRRLGTKTQVMTEPNNHHVRTRAIHTNEVCAIATQIARFLGLNVELVRAMALGHDIGHTPYGHDGEAFISKVTGKKFRHEIMSVVIAQHIERGGFGLNLTHETLTGMLNHSRGGGPLSVQEGGAQEDAVLMCADKIGYVFSDYRDLERIGFPIPESLVLARKVFPGTQRGAVDYIVFNLILESCREDSVSFCDSDVAKQFADLKGEMYKVYNRLNSPCYREVLEKVYEFLAKMYGQSIAPIALALLTDAEVIFLHSQSNLNITHLKQTSVWEILPTLQNNKIDIFSPDLDW